MTYFINNWALESGYVPPIMQTMALAVGTPVLGMIVFHFWGKRARRSTRNSRVHDFFVYNPVNDQIRDTTVLCYDPINLSEFHMINIYMLQASIYTSQGLLPWHTEQSLGRISRTMYK